MKTITIHVSDARYEALQKEAAEHDLTGPDEAAYGFLRSSMNSTFGAWCDDDPHVAGEREANRVL